jgi:hypothetical protein
VPKTTAQLKREIAESLAIAGATTPHSAKALATLAMMGTTPSQWQLTPIKWVEEEREVPGLVTCPTCHGHKFVRIVEGQVIPPPPYSAGHSVNHEYSQEAHRDARKAHKPYGNCPTCGKQKGGWGMIPQGKIKGLVRAKVQVGYPQFPTGTRFDSRFRDGLHCHLCNKLIMKSHRVPVLATGGDGITHGMFVGEDCAQKFLDVKLKHDDDSIMETGNAPAQ